MPPQGEVWAGALSVDILDSNVLRLSLPQIQIFSVEFRVLDAGSFENHKYTTQKKAEI